ncbi:MAG: hypothetical protein MJ151_02265, partial [Lachnospiraceae bacterium]|nr:hypothetical protein [Lachnospiraceae bacterium]
MRINLIETLGICAAVIVLVSMSFDTNSFRGNIYMRSFNLIGCIAYVLYGLALGSISLVLLNGALVFIHAYYLYKAYKMSTGGVKTFKKKQKEQIRHV